MEKSTNSPKKTKVSLLYRNTRSLYKDLRNLSDIPEMCDVKFLVGKNKVPVYGVKSILATRNRIFYSVILAQEKVDAIERKKQKRLSHKFKVMLKKLTKSDKHKSPKPVSNHLTIEMKEFEPVAFKKMIEFLITGSTSLDVHCVIGVMVAAARFGIDDLKEACHHFALSLLSVPNALTLLISSRVYVDIPCARRIRRKILRFIADHAEDVLKQNDFATLSKESVADILAEPDLKASEKTIQEAIYAREKTLAYGHQGPQVTSSHGDVEFRPINIDDLINQADILHAVSQAMQCQRGHARADDDVSNTSRDSTVSAVTPGCRYGRVNSTDSTSLAGSVTTEYTDESLLDDAFLCSSDELSLLSDKRKSKLYF